ncbi:MAG: CpsD/CapB family tyrosine-protein kinase [Caldilineaceae bacterium]|nr:CpsD/CapB family tyrosine-protein kinase [Caldilineaceae bacterium]MCY3991070.1 CpsD/CapB family tyrosine-protein kinase [Caldilineaceae bacterium]MDE0078922.1 CpsD/CapB family tyrosine-protein kinase [Caldilineaceae bacterium]MDE0312741.1 CpsD/CapB family tyrosine-protein kinase [Caldilineaceae bacterium]
MSLDLVTLKAPRSAAAEAYHSLRTNIEFSGLGRDLRTLLVTCPDTETNKSDALANLAVVMADAGDRVIVVDGDLRRPLQHEIFDINGDAGLTNWLQNGGVPPLAGTEVSHLRVLAAGPLPPNPVALLSPKRLAELLQTLTGEAEYVLVDAPPVLAVTDAALWASQVDGTLLAVTAGRTKREQAQRAKEVLEKVQTNIVGAVLLDAEDSMVVTGYGQ